MNSKKMNIQAILVIKQCWIYKKISSHLSDVDMIVNATLTADYKTPSVASYVQAKLELEMQQ